MINKNGLFFFLLVSTMPLYGVDVKVSAKKHAKVKLLICTIGKRNNKLESVAHCIRRDFLFTRQFHVVLDHRSSLHQERDLKQFFKQGFPLVLFLNKGKKSASIEWRLYDVEQSAMLVGKNYKKYGRSPEQWAHHIADSVWPILTGQPGLFSTKIAYCKEVRRRGKKVLKHIYIADYDGKNEKLLISTATVNVAPCWNRDQNNPLLFYSEHTNKNVRLVSADMYGRRTIVSNFDGINMLPAFSSDGKRVVFCASRGAGNCQLYYYAQGIFKKLTNNTGNNISPTFSEDGKTLFFCSDFETRGPQIYRYLFNSGKMERITHGGYCVSPRYCQHNNKLAYAKMIRGTMQIFLYDLATQKHTQITRDAGNKEECSWSPCGNYLLFAVETGKESRLALLNLTSHHQRFITAGGSVCCYPAWSCPYKRFPCVV